MARQVEICLLKMAKPKMKLLAGIKIDGKLYYWPLSGKWGDSFPLLLWGPGIMKKEGNIRRGLKK